MARSRSRVRVSRGTSARRKFVWARLVANSAVLPVAPGVHFADALVDFQTLYGADLIGSTLVRVRGEVKYNQSVTMGLRVFTQSTLPDIDQAHGPVNDPGADWAAYQPLHVLDPSGFTIREIDNKANRKVQEVGQGLLLVFQSKSASAGTISYDLSFGLKLP